MKPSSLLAFLLFAGVASAADLGPFFEPNFPFFQTPVDLRASDKEASEKSNFVVRGILLPLASGHCAVFDQDLLRFAGLWNVPAGQPPVSLKTMSQTSSAEPHRKSGADHPKPAGPLLLGAAMHPGVATSVEALLHDPRKTAGAGEAGRGPLPVTHGRFEGVELAGATAVLCYRVGGTAVREWWEVREPAIFRHFEIGPHAEPLFFGAGSRAYAKLSIASNSASFVVQERDGEIFAQLAPSATVQRVSLVIGVSETVARANATPPVPTAMKAPRWPESATTHGTLNTVTQDGLTLDRVELPESNPWQRRIRPADLGFLTPDRATVVTYDGDVWSVDGLADAALAKVTWRRFASGLNEPLAMGVVNGVVQVATKNGLVRLHDRDGNGEADFYENFSDLVRQSQGTRSFPLDMDFLPDGSTLVSQGGIAMGGGGTEFGGAIAKISPDGRAVELFSTRGREPYVTVHPESGLVTGTDQQGNFIPSSVCYLIRPGDSFGFGQEHPAKLTPPLVWIPHVEDSSCASQLWLIGAKFGPWNGRLLHLSYGTGRLFLIDPDLAAPVPQGAAIALGFATEMPLLQARLHPGGDAAFLCGFQIYDSRAKSDAALARLRPTAESVTTAIAARSCADGVILTFAAPLKPASVNAEHILALAWNYQRSKEYGSGRFKLNGEAGSDVLGVGQTFLSTDRKSVFVHLPKLPPVMQLEIRHDFELESGAKAQGGVYFTIHQPSPVDLAKAGFTGVDLTKSVAVIREQRVETASADAGRALSQSMGCVACHSVDGTGTGKTGPTWKGLFGMDRKFTDGSTESANEFYLRDSILDPGKKIVAGFQLGMASYRGVLTETQIESLILYIRSLR